MAVVRTGKAAHQIRDIGPASTGLARGMAVFGLVAEVGVVRDVQVRTQGSGEVERVAPCIPTPKEITVNPVRDGVAEMRQRYFDVLLNLAGSSPDAGILDRIERLIEAMTVAPAVVERRAESALNIPDPIPADPKPTAAAMAQASRMRGAARHVERVRKFTDGQMVEAILASGSYESAGRSLGVSGSAVRGRATIMASLPADAAARIAGWSRKK
jgi:hypothetical protein